MATGWMGGWRADATWLGWAGSRIVSIGHQRPGLTALAGALVVLAALEAIWIVRLRGRIAANRRDNVAPRLDKLAAAMTLLTDTTEAGLTALAVEVQRVQQKPAGARAASRGAVGKRVSTAKAKGESVKAIAATEALSEDEVRLHAALAAAVSAATAGGDARA